MKVNSRRVSLTTQFLRHANAVEAKLRIQKQNEHSVVTFYVAVAVLPKGSFDPFIYESKLLIVWFWSSAPQY
jgi:hypothetical protein